MRPLSFLFFSERMIMMREMANITSAGIECSAELKHRNSEQMRHVCLCGS